MAVRRHASTDASCGGRGDFIFGSLSLRNESPTLASRLGKVSLAAPFVPELMLLARDGSTGTVADRDSAAAIQFDATSPFAIHPVELPRGLSATGVSGLGLSRDGTRLAVLTDAPDAAVTYDNATLEVLRAGAATESDYLGEIVDFSIDAERLFVPTTDSRFADRITVLRTDDSSSGDEIRRHETPQGKVPVQARLNPEGTQFAVLLEDGAPVGEAGELTFLNLSSGRFLTPPIDLEDNAAGTVLASPIVYSADGSVVFLAGLGAVVAVATESPHTITRIDVSGGAQDSPVALDLSGDGLVLAVAVDDELGSVDFAVVDTTTFEVINAQDLAGIEPRGSIGVAHFQAARVAIVANFETSVVAVETVEPFASSGSLSAADVPDRTTLGRIVVGGPTIAVSNTSEPAIYLFVPASLQ